MKLFLYLAVAAAMISQPYVQHRKLRGAMGFPFGSDKELVLAGVGRYGGRYTPENSLVKNGLAFTNLQWGGRAVHLTVFEFHENRLYCVKQAFMPREGEPVSKTYQDVANAFEGLYGPSTVNASPRVNLYGDGSKRDASTSSESGTSIYTKWIFDKGSIQHEESVSVEVHERFVLVTSQRKLVDLQDGAAR